MAMQYMNNGNEGCPPELGAGIVKVLVIGAPRVGKTSFIRAFYEHHEPGEVDLDSAVELYRCEFAIHDIPRRAAILEIPGYPELFRGQRKPHYKDVKVIVLMYAIDDRESLDLLVDRWLPEVSSMTHTRGIPVVLLGNKRDLRDEGSQVVDHRDENLLDFEDGTDCLEHEKIDDFCEISTRNSEEVDFVFNLIFYHALNLQSEITF